MLLFISNFLKNLGPNNMSFFFNRLRSLKKIITDPNTRELYKIKYTNPNTFFSTKKIIIYAIVTYGGLGLYFTVKYDDTFALNLNMSRRVSACAGHLARINVPYFMRKFLYTSYAQVYNVKLEEIEQPLDEFENFLAFFTRKIKPLKIDVTPQSITSPADSKVLCFSEVSGNECLIVKGINYKIGELISGENVYQIQGETLQNIKKTKTNKLYQCILYLAPGDYHRFHSPVDMIVKKRIHIYGKLKPVKESYVKTHMGVYERNERVSIFGDWDQGKFCMVFVGALNVGSIELVFDPELKTNSKIPKPYNPYVFKSFYDGDETNKLIKLHKGDEIGRFNLGSTIVLLFEADPSFKWNIKEGDTLRYGQIIGKTEKNEENS